MLKLFALTLALFFTMPTFAMRAITSRSPQRGYATMAQKDFDRLVKPQQDGLPLPLDIFVSELDMMEKDDKDLKNLQRILNFRMCFFRCNSVTEWCFSEKYLPRSKAALVVGLGILSTVYIDCSEEMLVLKVLSASYFIGLGGYGILKWLPVKIENDFKHKVYCGYQKNLAYVESLIELQEKAMLKKIKDRYQE